MVGLLAAELAAGLLVGSELVDAVCANAAPTVSAVPSTSINVSRILLSSLAIRYDNRRDSLTFQPRCLANASMSSVSLLELESKYAVEQADVVRSAAQPRVFPLFDRR